ncbi:hypothetical protein B9Z55_009139 [Caenorhabditis nigoni]|uniref:Peptidase C83 domain-containing protein n=1 Tax=Caenorhabditis nigoni TaxID=1611254 RepID=A0A2G5UQS8_9PELO|nr:hypothetical protein B9Z55_009139 [Caenorhabditis nigoni]
MPKFVRHHVFMKDGNVMAVPLADPSPDTIAALQQVKDLNVEGFYTALRDLYLADGFSTESTMNLAILTQSVIPDFQYQEAIQALNNTQYEIKNGDYSLRRIKGMIELNKPDALIHQNWLIDLVSLILEQSERSKELVYSIRDLGTALIANGYSREAYPNRTMLRTAIQEFLTKNFEDDPLNKRYLEPLVLLHHVVGPENFDLLGNVLEAQPWLTKGGMLPRDAEYFRMYQDRIMEAISDSDVGITVLSGFQKAYEDIVNSTGVPDTLLNRLTVSSIRDGSVFDGGYNTEEHFDVFSEIWRNLRTSSVRNKFVYAVKWAILGEYGPKIGGMESLRNAFIAGARLIKNLGGSVANANSKCQEAVAMYSHDSIAYTNLHRALQIVLKLSKKSENGREGYKDLFDLYFEKTAPTVQLFSPSRFESATTMEAFFTTMKAADPAGLLTYLQLFEQTEEIDYLAFSNTINMLSDDSTLVQLSYPLLLYQPNSFEDAVNMRAALRSIVSVSKDGVDLVEYIRSVREILRTGDSQNFFNTLSTLSKTTRNGSWMDVHEALALISLIYSPGSSEPRLAPFRGLEAMLGADGSHQEVFLALQTILEDPETSIAKCQFISDCFTGLEDVTFVVEALGVKTDEIKRNVEDTVFVDALIQLLQASESRDALGRMIGFHTKHTVNQDASQSILMIEDLLKYMEKNQWR